MKFSKTKVFCGFGLSLLLLSGCNGGGGSSSIAPKNKPKDSNDLLPQEGQGWNSLTGTLAPDECFQVAGGTNTDGTTNPGIPYQIAAPNVVAYYSMGQSMAQEILNFKFKFAGDFSSSAPFETFNIKTDQQYKMTMDTLTNTITVFTYVTRTQGVQINYPSMSDVSHILNAEGQKIYNNSPLAFKKECGDSLIQEAEYQASYLVRLDITASSTSALYDLEFKLQSSSSAGSSPIEKVSDDISTEIASSIKDTGATFNLTYSAEIDGGPSAAVLPTTVSCNSFGSNGTLDCSSIISGVVNNMNNWAQSFPTITGAKGGLPSGELMEMDFLGKIKTKNLAEAGFKFPTPNTAESSVSKLYSNITKRYTNLVTQIDDLGNYENSNSLNSNVQNEINSTVNSLSNVLTNAEVPYDSARVDCNSGALTACTTDLNNTIQILDISPTLNILQLEANLGSSYIVKIQPKGTNTTAPMTYQFAPTFENNGVYSLVAGGDSNTISLLNLDGSTSDMTIDHLQDHVPTENGNYQEPLYEAPSLISSDSKSVLYTGLTNDLGETGNTSSNYSFTSVNPDLPLLNGKPLQATISYKQILNTAFTNSFTQYPGNRLLVQDLFANIGNYIFVLSDPASKVLPVPIYAYVIVLEDDGNLAEYALTSPDYNPKYAIKTWATAFNNIVNNNLQVTALRFDHKTGSFWLGTAQPVDQGYSKIISQGPVNNSANTYYGLKLQADGNLAIYDTTGNVIWQNYSNTPNLSGKALSRINISDPANVLYTD